MAGEFKKFDEAVAKFNKDHGVSFSFEQFETERKKTAHMREFFTNNSDLTVEDYTYRTMLPNLYKEAVENAILKKTASVDHSALFKDFEKLMDSYRQYRAENGENPLSKNGGWKSGVTVVTAMQEKLKNIPADKSDYMKNNYVGRSIRLRDMRADLEGMEKDGKAVTAEELSRAIVYARALEKAIESRSAGWRAIHWFQGPAEKRDLKTINAFIEKHRNSDIFDKAVEFADENEVGKENSKLEKAKKEISSKELVRPRRLHNFKEADPRINNKELSDYVHKQILDIVKKSKTAENDKSIITRAMILNVNLGAIRLMWNDFGKATTAEDKEKILHNGAQKIFKASFEGMKGLTNLDEHDRMVASQKITDLLLKQYSPATSDKAYDKFADNYVISDENFVRDFMRRNWNVVDMSGDELKDIIKNMKIDIERGKEKVNIPASELSSKLVDKSAKPVDVPKLDRNVKVH